MNKTDHDPVENPSHYTSHPSGIECLEITRHMSFNCGNAVKYIWRHGEKDPTKKIEDLMKAKFYINDEIEKLGREMGSVKDIQLETNPPPSIGEVDCWSPSEIRVGYCCVLVGLKPHCAKNWSEIKRLLTKYMIFNKATSYVPCRNFIRKLYEGNRNLDSCLASYSQRPWIFLVAGISSKNLVKRKRSIRNELMKKYGEDENPANNFIHMSDSAEAGEREVELFNNLITE